MRQKGFIIIPILIAIALVISGTLIYLGKDVFVKPKSTPGPVAEVTASPTSQNSQRQTASTPTPIATKTSIPKTPTPKPATPKPTASPNTCDINVQSVPDNSMAAQLIYSSHSTNGSYTTGAQWDYDGNGTWDTDMSIGNGNIIKTFPSNGTYNVKLHLSMSDGSTTPTCSKSVTIPTAATSYQVKFTGRVYSDANCNDLQEPWETGIAGVNVDIDTSNGVYATVTTDSNGYFEFKTNLGFGGSLNFTPHNVAPSGYKIFYSPHATSLNQNQSSLNQDLPQVAYENLSSCPI